MKQISDTHGTPDILVNNAATNPYFGPLMGLEWSAFDKTIAVNLKGPLELSRKLVQSHTQKKLYEQRTNCTTFNHTRIQYFWLGGSSLYKVYMG